MSGVTVGDILRLALPAGSRLVGGASGLGREVAWAVVLRPEALSFEELDGGELVLLASTAPDVFLGQPWLVQLLDRLNAEMVAAVAMAGEVPPGVRELADRLGLPTISMPEGVVLHEVERLALGTILNHRAQLEQRGVQIYRQLAQLVTGDRGIGAIIETLHQITGKTVLFQDEKLRLQLWAVEPDTVLERAVIAAAVAEQDWVRNWLQGAALVSTAPPIGRQELPSLGLARFVAPIVVKDAVVGYVSILGPGADLSELDRVATGRAASVCAMELAKQRAVVETEQRVRGDFLGDLLEGRISDREAILARAKSLGLELSPVNVVVCFGALPANTEAGGGREMGETPGLLPDLVAAVADELGHHGIKCLTGIRAGGAAALCGLPTAHSQRTFHEVIESVRRRVAERLGGARVSAGASRPCASLLELPRAATEANQALAVAQRVGGGERALWFDDLGVYRLLLPLKDTHHFHSFANEYLARLVDYDEKHGRELIPTLQTYLACCGNYSRAAERLALHRNTLSYRLRRIEELTNLDLDDAENRLCLQLALKIRELAP